MFSMFGYILTKHSPMFGNIHQSLSQTFWILLLFTTILLSILHLSKLHGIIFKSCFIVEERRKYFLSDWKARQERIYPLLDTFTPVFGFLILFIDSPSMAVFLILYSSWQFMRSLTMFPRVGRHVFITSQVTGTISEFLLSYLIEILAFTISFHILLKENEMFRYVSIPFLKILYIDNGFRSLDDSFVVVVTMLLGELDWGLAIESHENVMVTRIVFLLFIMMMSIVLINLVIGLSISDISALR